MKKSIWLPVLALAVAGSLAACNGGNGGGSSGGSSGGGRGGATAIGNYVGASQSERTQILGALEKYAVDNLIAGLPLYEDGGFTMYSSRVVKGVQSYIPGYGFGILRSGSLNGTLSGTIGQENPTFYHTASSSDPNAINVWDNNGSQVSDLHSYMSASYYGTTHAASGDSYEWIPILAKTERPWIVENAGTANETAREATANDSGYTWRIYVRTNDASAVYRTASTKSDRANFNNRKIALDDYLTTFKIMLTGGIGFYRGEELAGQTGRYGIAGASEYYAATKDSGINDELFASTVGVKTGTDSNGDYIQATMLGPTTRFYFMYTFSDSLYMPIPRDFWNAVTNNGATPANFFSYTTDKSYGLVDNSLSVGPYYLSSWAENSNRTIFAKNDSWKEYDPATGAEVTGIYNIPGVQITVYPGATEDDSLIFKEFLANNLDAAGIPLDYLEQYKSDSRTVQVPGSSVWKLNVNSCTQEQWEYLFGESGTVTHTAKADYYTCKPWMSNDDFIKGLFFSLDRNTFANTRGYTSSINYFSSIYMSDPEGGVAYNTTDAHKNAIADFWGDTVNTGGYSLSLSQAAFDSAITALLADGSIKDGDTLEVSIVWQANSQITTDGNDLAGYMETAFNGCTQATAHNIKLEITQFAPSVWSDTYYKHLMVGQYDLGFGSISGNSLDPLNFMEVLKSNNSSGFTLNWGPDTAEVGISYDGQLWSFDTLWAAADHGVCVYQGEEVRPAGIASIDTTVGEDNSLAIAIDYYSGNKFLEDRSDEAEVKAIIDSGNYNGQLDVVNIYEQTGGFFDFYVSLNNETGVATSFNNGAYQAEGFTVTWDSENEVVTIVLTNEYLTGLYAAMNEAGYGDYFAAGLVYYFTGTQRIVSLETSISFSDTTVTDLSHWVPVAAE